VTWFLPGDRRALFSSGGALIVSLLGAFPDALEVPTWVVATLNLATGVLVRCERARRN
jgi:hypothetical protein